MRQRNTASRRRVRSRLSRMARHFFNGESAFRKNRRVAGGPRYSHDRKSAGSHRSERHDRHTADIESNDLPGLAAARVVQLVQSPKLGEAERSEEHTSEL